MRALKVFRFDPTDATLSSPYQGLRWTGPTVRVDADSIVPSQAGIHAFRSHHRLHEAAATTSRKSPIAIGLMDCREECVKWTGGIVSRTATIRHLWVPPDTPPRLRDQLQLRYGCRVTTTLHLPWGPLDAESVLRGKYYALPRFSGVGLPLPDEPHLAWREYQMYRLMEPRFVLVPYHSTIASTWRRRLKEDQYLWYEYLVRKYPYQHEAILRRLIDRTPRDKLVREYVVRTQRHLDLRGASAEQVRRAVTQVCRLRGGIVADSMADILLSEWSDFRIALRWRCGRPEWPIRIACAVAVRDGDEIRMDVRTARIRLRRFRGLQDRIVQSLYGSPVYSMYRTGARGGAELAHFPVWRTIRHTDGSVTLVVPPTNGHSVGVRYFPREVKD